jgi:hypothetical protein
MGIRTIIKEIKQNGEQLPAPSKLEDIMAYSDYADATAYLVVSVPEAKTRTEKRLLEF